MITDDVEGLNALTHKMLGDIFDSFLMPNSKFSVNSKKELIQIKFFLSIRLEQKGITENSNFHLLINQQGMVFLKDLTTSVSHDGETQVSL